MNCCTDQHDPSYAKGAEPRCCGGGEREFDYTNGAERALEKAVTSGWTVVSIKDDWATVF